MSELELRNALGDLVDPCLDERPDWDDVLKRAAVTVPEASRTNVAERPRRRRRVILGGLALAGALVALVATPAFGLRDAVLGAIGRTDVEFDEGEPAPSIVRYRFEDLGIGAPPAMAPRAIANQARRVGTLRVRGKQRALWVAPTRLGGFCFELEHAYGGCQRYQPRLRRLPPVALTFGGQLDPQGVTKVTLIAGTVLASSVARLTIEFRDGATRDVPFLFVSSPIDAGFFSFDVPADRQTRARGPLTVVARGARGRVIWRADEFRYGQRHPPRPPVGGGGIAARRPLPPRPPVPPTAPLQRAEAHGATVVVGSNAVAVFDASALEQERRRMLDGKAVSYVCFRLVRRDGVLHDRGLGIYLSFRPRGGLRYFGVGTPFDACEIQGSYGHRWPDRLDSHSPVELPFTETARRYFEDRAAARTLALFVRGRRMQQLRREGAQLSEAVPREFGDRIFRLSSRTATPTAGALAYWPDGAGATFVTSSTTGRRFEVVVENGRIARQNVRPLAFVF